VKQRRISSPLSVSELQPFGGNVIVIAPSSVSCENTEIGAEEMQSLSLQSENLAASPSADAAETEETANLSVKPEFIEHSADSPVTENVNASMSQLSLTSNADTAPPVGDAKIQQQTAVKTEITANTEEDAPPSFASNDVLVNNQEVHGLSVQLAAASVDEQTDKLAELQAQLQQQVTVNSQAAEAGCGDQTSTDVGDVASSRISTYQTDVAMYKQEASSSGGGDTAVDVVAGCKKEATSDSTSETFTSCAPLSPAASDSVFCSPQSNISENKNNNSESPSVQQQQQQQQQGVQHSLADTLIAPRETKIVIYSRHDSSIAGERTETDSECTRGVLTTENKTEEDAVDHHNSKNEKSEELYGAGDNKDQEREVDDGVDDVDDTVKDDDDDDGDGDDDEGRVDDMRDKHAADEKIAVEPQKTKGEMDVSAQAKKKKKKKKKNKEQNKQTQSAGVVESVITLKRDADDVESLQFLRPPQMQSKTVNSDKQTENEATESATGAWNRLGSDADSKANDPNDAVNHQGRQDTADTGSDKQKRVQTASSPSASNAKVCKCSIFDAIYQFSY